MKLRALFSISTLLLFSLSTPSYSLEETKAMPYGSIGFAIGNLWAHSEGLKSMESQFFQGSLFASYAFTAGTSLTLQGDWYRPAGITGGGVILQQYFFPSLDISPYVALGGGLHYTHQDNTRFGLRFGPSARAGAGFTFFRLSPVQLQVGYQYLAIGNSKGDQGSGIFFALSLNNSRPEIRPLKY
jgi:hypothetical protein